MRNGEHSAAGDRKRPVSHGAAADSPIVVLSYAYSAADQVQEVLAAGDDLACTIATGVIPLCDIAAETWRRVEGHSGQVLSRLAVSTIRGLVAAQVTTILAAAGKSRWCELATAAPSAMGPFLQVFPHAAIVCVHRSCLDVIRAGIQASPWGLQGQGLVPYLLSYPGNSVATLAAYWAHSTEELLAFEKEHAEVTHRVRYEDVAADPTLVLATIRACLKLGNAAIGEAIPRRIESVHSDGAREAAPGFTVPVELIPAALRQRIIRLHAELGYPPPEG